MRDGSDLWKGKKKMNREQFMESTNKLEGLYGKKLNDTQIEFWFEQLSGYDVNKYKRAINEIGKNNKTMPTIADVLAKIKSIRFDEKPTEDYQKVKCEKCNGSGYIKYIRDDYEYLCTCDCENGKRNENPYIQKYRDVFPQASTTMVYNKKNNVVEVDFSQINF